MASSMWCEQARLKSIRINIERNLSAPHTAHLVSGYIRGVHPKFGYAIRVVGDRDNKRGE